jgi:hypothetical protein
MPAPAPWPYTGAYIALVAGLSTAELLLSMVVLSTILVCGGESSSKTSARRVRILTEVW